MKTRLLICTALLALAPAGAWAEVSLASIFTDNMVLQREAPLVIWGKAADGESVAVTVAGQSASTQAVGGEWRVTLDPLKTSLEPVAFQVKGEGNAIALQNVVVGEVWICGGQSNMVWPLGQSLDARTDVPQANHPNLRIFDIKSKKSFYKLDAVAGGQWEPCTPKTARDFSAAGYYFGVDLLNALGGDVPVGLIGMSYSGTETQAWTSLEGLQAEPSLKHYADIADYSEASIAKLTEHFHAVIEPEYNAAMAKFEEDKKNKVQPKPEKPEKVRPPASDPNLPAVLYNGMVHPIIPFTVRGMLWYQGGSNGRSKEAAIEYATLLPNLFRDLRGRWGQQEFPIVYVQHAGWRPNRSLPFLFEAQRLTLNTAPDVAMVTTTDVGERSNVHPANKKTVGQRLALAALGLAYGKEGPTMGPIFTSATVENGKIRVAFANAQGLKIGEIPVVVEWSPQPPTDRLAGFEVAGADGEFQEAQAEIDGSEVVVWSEEVSSPKYVRYGWSSWPEVNLYNQADLPASPFTSLDYHELPDAP